MRLPTALFEAGRSAGAARGFAIANFLAVFVASLAGYLTVGQTAAAEADVSAELRSTSARLVAINAEQASLALPNASLLAIASRDDVLAVLVVGPAVDAANQAYPQVKNFAPVRDALLIDPGGNLVSLEAPAGAPGTVALPPALEGRMQNNVGGLILPNGVAHPVAGTYRPNDALEPRLQTGLRWIEPTASTIEMRSLFVLAARIDSVPLLDADLPRAIGVSDPLSISIETPRILSEISAAVEGRLGNFSRSLILGVLAFSFGWVGITTWAWVYTRRRDIGRRRALGATRGFVVYLIIAQVLLSAALATTLAYVVHIAAAEIGAFDVVPLGFGIAQAALLIVSALAAAILPATIAAYRDPIRVLRIP